MSGRPDKEMETARIEAGRRRARRTALVVGAVALAIYVAFILSGVVGR